MKNPEGALLHGPRTTVHGIVFFLFFGLYLYTAYPTVAPYRDSGDLSAAAVTLGIAHPPGYPLYSIIGRAWLSFLYIGDAAYRINVLSALSGALAVALLFVSLEPLGLIPALGGALFLGLAPCFWKLSLLSEMYSLNAFFASLLLVNLLCPDTVAAQRRWPLIGLILGLGLVNHQTIILLAPGMIFFLPPWGRWREPSWRATVGATLAFIALGLAIYLFLPLRSMQDPVLNWGEPHTFRNFLRILTRADYGGMRLHPERPFTVDAASLRDAASLTWQAFSAQSSVLLLLCAVGAWARRREPLARFCLAGFILSGPFFVFLSNLPPGSRDSLPILEPHLLLPVLCLAPLFAYGLTALGSGTGYRLVAPALALIPAGLWAMRSTPSHRYDFSAHDYEKSVLSAVPKGSVLIDPDDPTAFTLSYFNAARDFRPDVVPLAYFRTRWGYEQLHRRHPDVVPSSSITSGHELYYYVVRYNLEKGRGVYGDLPHKALPPYKTFPEGWAYRFYDSKPPADGYARSLALWELSRARPPASDDFFTVHSLEYGASALNNLGVQALNDKQWAVAEASFKRALVKRPELDQAWNNWGNALYQKKDYPRSAAAYRLALAIKRSPQYRYNLGRTLMADGRKDEAETEMQAAIDAADIPDAVNDLGLLWLQKGESQRAADAFEALLTKHRDYRPAVYNLGLARAQLGQKDAAAAAFKYYRDTAADPADKADADSWLKKLK